MSYSSNTEYGSALEGLGCGSDCKCGPCKAGLSGTATTPSLDQRVLQDALRRGVRNLRQLTVAIYLARHPEQRAEWVAIRDRIARPALQQISNGRGTVRW